MVHNFDSDTDNNFLDGYYSINYGITSPEAKYFSNTGGDKVNDTYSGKPFSTI